jgi:hypothetical protein
MTRFLILALAGLAALAAACAPYPYPPGPGPYPPPPPSYPYPPGPPPMTPRPTAGIGESCGGFAGIMCRDSIAFCQTAPQAQCGAADQPGVCTVRPQACTREYNPVCGCDGRSYGNACEAASNGASVAYPGQCVR